MLIGLDAIRTILERIARDHRSGSGTLLQRLTDNLLTYLITDHTFQPEETRLLRKELTSFRKRMKDFAIISHFTDHLIAALPANRGITSAGLYDSILVYKKKWRDVNERIIRMFLQTVSPKNMQVLIHSQSSVIRDLFKSLTDKDRNISIIQTESRPMMEGQEQAKFLAGLGYPVKVITDAGFTPLLGVIDIVILGADRIYPDVFINKCGSHAITLLSRRQDIPVYVLADSRKLIQAPTDYNTLREQEKPSGEVWQSPPKGIIPVNYYFEPIPTKLVNAFVTEDRIIPGKEMLFTSLGQ